MFISIASLCTSSQNLHVSENASPPLLEYVPNKMQFKEYVMKHRNCFFVIWYFKESLKRLMLPGGERYACVAGFSAVLTGRLEWRPSRSTKHTVF